MNLFNRKSKKKKPQGPAYMDPNNIWFSLPTIAMALPETLPVEKTTEADIQMHEDHYRQSEFLKADDLPIVVQELVKIREIWEQHSDKGESHTLFKKCHARTNPASPNLEIPWDDLKEVLNFSATGQLIASGRLVKDGFAFRTEATSYFGRMANGCIETLCVAEWSEQSVEEIKAINNRFNLLFVNWVHCELTT